MSSRIIITESLEHELPFKEALSWENFQLLCTDILASDPQFIGVRDFLKQGNEQQGIDVYAVPVNNGKMTVAQCKLKDYIPPGELQKILNKFLEGDFNNEATGWFILCTNFDFKTQEAENAIADIRTQLKARGIDLILWDKHGLETELRILPRPQIVSRYFGAEIALAFYGETFKAWIKEYLKVPKRVYTSYTDHIERTLTLQQDALENQNYWNKDANQLTLSSMFAFPIPNEGKRLVVLSVAGFGKTWEMKQLAAFYAGDDKVLFPILNYLKDYEGQSIDTILQQHEINVPKENLLLIFDGFDEIRGIHLQSFINHLNQFAEAHPKVNIAVSSRFNFYNLNYPPLRDFNVYFLNEFSTADITSYLAKNIPRKEDAFQAEIIKKNFSEYIKHPYYLSRLVRFFKDQSADFPKNRSELFERILFERFETDKHKYNVDLKKAEFRICAEKVAFCLTMVGTSTLSEEELDEILPERDVCNTFKRLFLLTTDVTSINSLAFEHKNLQEYLCASYLSKMSFANVKALMTFKHAPEILQTRYLNTVSFLFILVDKHFFDELLLWLQTSQPDVIVRFEQDRITPTIRFEILKNIIQNYASKGLGLFSSTAFSIEELADFVDLDTALITYLEQLILNAGTNDWLAYDLVNFFSVHKKAFTAKNRLSDILLKALPTRNHLGRFGAGCIRQYQTLAI